MCYNYDERSTCPENWRFPAVSPLLVSLVFPVSPEVPQSCSPQLSNIDR